MRASTLRGNGTGITLGAAAGGLIGGTGAGNLFTATGLLTGTRVQSNLVTGTRTHGVRLYGLTATGICTGSVVRRNTIVGNGIDVSIVGARGLVYVP